MSFFEKFRGTSKKKVIEPNPATPAHNPEEGPKVEILSQEGKAKLQNLLSKYEIKIKEGPIQGRGEDVYKAPEVLDPYYFEALYGKDFIEELLQNGHIYTYAFTRSLGKGFVQNGFLLLMQQIVAIEKEEKKTL